MRFATFAALLTLLTGCFDADITLTFSEDGSVQIDEVTTMSGELALLAAENGGCVGGTANTKDGVYTCTRQRNATLDAFLANSQTLGFGPNGEGPHMTAKLLDDETLMLTIAFDDTSDFEAANGMESLLQNAVKDNALTFRVSGYKIIETTGTVAESVTEGTATAERVIPLAGLLSSPPDFGPDFTTTVQFAPKCWLFGLFCD